EALLCLPATLIALAAGVADGSGLQIGGETCHPKEKGAHTGDISAEMLKDAGAAYVITGHSERRTDHGETDARVSAQSEAAIRAGLTPIICVGESLAERDAGRVIEVVGGQIAGSIPPSAKAEAIVIAYEPVWAIGTGRVASPDQIAEVHAFIRSALIQRFGEAGAGVRILYGGSVNPGNAGEIFAVDNVDGGLIGGASLKAADFLSIYSAAAG
ncbi:MAG: triose-phosphate isomerase, partial [Ferrovibrio sp.]